ncbi:MAG TPA: hypothetical protein DD671_09585 [Balneolaceae bacterium]|nr:hypothetical protein [Balneolaceae bacterium]
MNENIIAVDSVAPYQATWRPGIDGCYDFQVKAYDNLNNMGSSTQETVFIVGTGCEKRAFNDEPQTFPGTLQFEHYDYGGLDNAYYDTSPDTNLGNNLGNEFRDTEAVDLIPDKNQEGNHLLTELEAGEWTTYQIEVTQSGSYDLELRAVGGSQSGRLDFMIEDEDLVYYTRLVARDGEPYISKTITDVELTEGSYELKMDVVQDGNGLKPDRLKAILTESITSNESSRGIPSTVTLHQNYPNPFNPNTNISFSLDRPQHTHLSVYNSLGQHIKTLYSGTLTQGSHSFSFDASGYSSGIYYYQLTTSTGTWTRQMLLLK